MNTDDLERLCINTIRTLSMDAIQKANSGHPGAPLGMAPAAYVLFTKIMKHHPRNPGWEDRDRFVLSAGHASALLYSLLHLTGYDLSLDDLKAFRQWGSKTPGHPEYGHTPGVETTTGPLGQGIANAVGMAMAERYLAALFNRPDHTLVDHFTYVLCGDGDLMEGVSAEAASLAGHLGLGKLICLYDDNQISIEGSTDITFTEDVGKRFQAYGWQVLNVPDGNDTVAIARAVKKAARETARPTLIRVRTVIAYGSPNKAGTADAHGAPLGEEEVGKTKQCLGCEPEAFYIPEPVRAAFRKSIGRGSRAEKKWQTQAAAYEKQFPQQYRQYRAMLSGELPQGWDRAIPLFSPQDGPVATRAASGKVLNGIAPNLPALLGGSADLAPSNKTLIAGSGDFARDAYDQRNIRFGVREHAMASICSGMALHGGVKPYCGTFLVFADYMRPAIRVAALMKLPVVYVFTHDSIAVGEDGPTHQPVEHLASLRCIPGLTVIRPADANETAEAWRQALQAQGPFALILSRQKLPVIDRAVNAPAADLARGAYVLAEPPKPELLLLATGSEVWLAIGAAAALADKGVQARVVSMPCWELFEQQPPEYRQSVLPPDLCARLVIEAASPFGWERYAGPRGKILGISGFGSSAPGGVVLEKYGYCVQRVVEQALQLLGKQ